MSVFIPGMEMPLNSYDCPLNSFGICNLANDAEHSFCYNERPKYCPLVEVKTPHGELIERKSAKVRFCQHCHWKESIENACDICAACPIDLIPTIIEAEGGGEMIISELHLEEEPKPHKCSCGATPQFIYNGLLWVVECPKCFNSESGWTVLDTINAWNRKVDKEGGDEDG